MLSEEVRKKITDASVLEEIEALEQQLNEVTKESIGRKKKINELTGNLKRLELDPDSDLEEQLTKKLEKSKEGYKPSSDYEAVLKKVDKLNKEMESWKSQAEASTKEAQMAKARAAFSGKLAEHFGPAADLLLELGTTKGQITVSPEGIPGVYHDEEFVPLHTEKGKNAIDTLRKLYPTLAITKQVSGGKDVSTRTSGESKVQGQSMARQDFDALPPEEQYRFMKSGGALEE
jgi:hypothetical protein